MKHIDISNQVFGKLTAISKTCIKKHGKRLWKCVCSCGKEHFACCADLRRGRVKSCGCSRNSSRQGINIVHGMSGTPEHRTWIAMKQRCYNRNFKQYSDYGGRGIRVCDEWKNSFSKFYADMGNKPTLSHCIERKNNSGDYTPDNCVWATRLEQMNNTRKNRLFTFKNKTLSVSRWAESIGIHRNVLLGRINRGWPIEKALTSGTIRR